MVQGRWQQPRQWWPLVLPTSITVSASGGVNVAMVYGQNQPHQGCSLEGTSSAVKSKGLLGWWIYTWIAWSSCLYSPVHYDFGNCLLTFLNCHWISSKVGWFPNPCTHSREQECSMWLDPPPVNIFHKKRNALPGPITTTSMRPVLISCSISSTRGATQEWGGRDTTPNFSINVICILRQYLVLGWPEGNLLAREQDGKW